MKIQVAVPNTVSVDVKNQYYRTTELRRCVKVEVDVSVGLIVPNSPYGLCGSLNKIGEFRSCVKVEVMMVM